MSIIIDLPAEFESELREQAKKVNLDPDTYIFEALQEHLRRRQHQPPHLSEAESELLQQINIGLSQEEWRRYHELVARRRAEKLDKYEQQELIGLSDRIEKANARRMQALVDLAQLRQTSLQAVMKELGIKQPSYV